MRFLGKTIPELIAWRGQRKAKLHESYQDVFASLPGKQVLNHICLVGFITKSTHVPGDRDTSLLNEGKRALALEILKFVHKDHKLVLKHIENQIKQHTNYET